MVNTRVTRCTLSNKINLSGYQSVPHFFITMKNFVVIDLMPCMFALVNAVERANSVGEGDVTKLLVDSWVRFFANPPLYCPIHRFDPYDASPILVTDSKVAGRYWRHRYHTTYKSGRSSKSQLLTNITRLVTEGWVAHDLPLLREDGFEADDFAGAIVRSLSPTDRCLLVTVDGDWAQLVSNRVGWLDTYPPSKRKGESQKRSVLFADEVLERFNNQKAFIRNGGITSPSDIARYKWEYGDSSDSIPPGRLAPLGIIDLLDPLESPDMSAVREVMDRGVNRVSYPAITSPYMFGLPTWVEG